MRRSLLIPALLATTVVVTACGDSDEEPVLDTSPEPTALVTTNSTMPIDASTSPESSTATNITTTGE